MMDGKQKTMTKIYINEEGRPMHNPNGWPDINRWHPGHGMKEDYLDALEKAKAESVPFDMDHDVTFRFMELAAPEQNRILGNLITTANGEVEVVYQRDFSSDYKKGPRWEDVSKEAYDHYQGPYAQRKVARIKKQESDDKTCKECGADHFEDCKKDNWGDGCSGGSMGTIAPVNPHVAIGWKQVEPLTFGEEMEQIRRYGQDMQRENAELKAKVEKAEARIKELEFFLNDCREGRRRIIDCPF